MEYKCNICNKIYSSYQSLWIHNKKFHNKIVNNKTTLRQPVVSQKTSPISIKTFNCNKCSKIYMHKQSKYRHEKKCNKSIETNNTQIIEKNINNKTKNINNGSINNGTIINKNIIKFGSEDIKNILTNEQIHKIVNSRLLAIEESIKQIHFNKDKPEYQNIKINNLRSNIALVHDGEQFNVTNQYSAISTLIDNHVESIEQILDDKKSILPIRTVEKLEMLIGKLEDNYKKIIDEETNRSFKNYKDYKVDTVKNMLYNESNKITKN